MLGPCSSYWTVQLLGGPSASLLLLEPLHMQADGEQRSPACPTVSAGPAAPRGAHRLAVRTVRSTAAKGQSLRLHACLPTALLQQTRAGGVKKALKQAAEVCHRLPKARIFSLRQPCQ